MSEIVSGPGYAVGDLDMLGEGYGFRKIRRGLDVKELGVNAIVMPAGFETSGHYHDEQEELYFVHRGRIAITFGDGTTHELGEGGLARVDAPTVRSLKNVGDGDAIYVIVGAKGGYVGRDGRLPDGTTSRVAPGAADAG
jgi:quercetin dioxygenase-like cupin family protein